MGERVRAQIGSALPDRERQGAPSPVAAPTEEDSMSVVIRELVFGWEASLTRATTMDASMLFAMRTCTHDADSPAENRLVP